MPGSARARRGKKVDRTSTTSAPRLAGAGRGRVTSISCSEADQTSGGRALALAAIPTARIFEFRSRLQLIACGVHIGVPLLVVVVIFDRH